MIKMLDILETEEPAEETKCPVRIVASTSDFLSEEGGSIPLRDTNKIWFTK